MGNLMPSKSQLVTIGWTLAVLALIYRVDAAKDILLGK